MRMIKLLNRTFDVTIRNQFLAPQKAAQINMPEYIKLQLFRKGIKEYKDIDCLKTRQTWYWQIGKLKNYSYL
jgi:hypothetical protein